MDTHTTKHPDLFVSKREVAMAYSPNHTPHAALKRLARWMKACRPLMKALQKTGYNEMQHKFSKRQLSLIYKHLGEP